MKTILVDDEPHNLENLKILLETYCPDVEICGTAADAHEATNLLYNCKPDVVFLDIQMPGQNGFDWLGSLPNNHFGVIFVTAFDQYAIRALRLAAVDYLLKPISIDELQLAVERARNRLLYSEPNSLIQNLVHALKNNQDEQRIALSTSGETRFAKTKEIIRCESANNYTTFYLNDGEVIVVCKPIYLYDELLRPFGFVRCHQSHLVNIIFIKSWKKEYGDFLLLHNGTEVPVSRNKREDVRKILGAWI